MKYSDPRMEEYFSSLPLQVRNYIQFSHADISSLGELTLIGEHLKLTLDAPEDGPRR